MPVAPDAVLTDEQGRAVLRFERPLPHPPEKVWRSLTETDRLHSWHPTPFELEPRRGGAVRYLSGGNVEMPEGEVIEYDPPRLLAHTWDEDVLRWELQAHDDGCVLILTHTFDDRFKAARDAAGWHQCLDALAKALGGAEGRLLHSPPSEDEDWPPRDWQELNRLYEERFGIPPEKATPPPGR